MARRPWVAFLLLASCGGDPSSLGKTKERPDTGAPSSDGASEGTLVPSACIFNQGGPPQPVIEQLHPEIIEVACAGRTTADVISIQNTAGQGFDWTASVESPNHFFTPDPETGSACPGFALIGIGGCGVIVAPPPGAVPGDSDEGTLTVVTSDPSIGPVTARLQAAVVTTSFRAAPTTLNFGPVAVGQSGSIAVTISNTTTIPILVHPEPPPTLPFSVQSWGPHGEDVFVIPDLPPGQSGEMLTFFFSPQTAGVARLELDLTTFASTQGLDPACGSPVHITLVGEGVADAGDAGSP